MTRLPTIVVGVLILLLIPLHVGSSQWMQNGRIICQEYNDQVQPRVVSDGSGGAYIIWRDGRTGDFTNNGFLYGQHLNAQGVAQWQNNGMHLHSGKGANNHDVKSDGSGGVVLTWTDARDNAPGLYIQKVGSSGPVWQDSGVFVCSTGKGPNVTANSGSSVVVWTDTRAGVFSDLYAQKFDDAGSTQWQANGVAVKIDTALSQFYPMLAEDGAGGHFVVFIQNKTSTSNIDPKFNDLYVRRINSDGTIAWNGQSFPVCTASDRQSEHRVIKSNNGSCIAVWNDYRSGTRHIYGQKWDQSGNMLWGQNGKALLTPSGNGANLQTILCDGEDGVIIFALVTSLIAQRWNGGGNLVWSITASGGQAKPGFTTASSLSNGDFIVGWDDVRFDMGDIFVQKGDVNGNLYWSSGGVAICKANSQQRYPWVASDGSGGVIAAWEDQRISGYMIDVYAGRVDGQGYNVPIELKSLSGEQIGTHVLLQWTTASETNNRGFSIERDNGNGWNKVGFVVGAVNSTTVHSYSFIDENPSSGAHIIAPLRYRLKQIDMDGTENFSNVVTVEYRKPSLDAITMEVYPNPLMLSSSTQTARVTIGIPAALHGERWNVTMHDLYGRCIQTLFSGTIDEGMKSIPLNGTELRAGTYFLSLSSSSARIVRMVSVAR